MDAATNQTTKQYDAWQDVGTTELSPFVSANLNLELLPESDMMNIVMKRKLGGSRNEEGSPPEKRLKQESHLSSTDISSVKEWSNSLSGSVNDKHLHDVCSSSTPSLTIGNSPSISKLKNDCPKGLTGSKVEEEDLSKELSTSNKVGDECNVTDKLHEDHEKGFHCVMEVDSLKHVESSNLVGIKDNYPINLNNVVDITSPNNKSDNVNAMLAPFESVSPVRVSQTNTLSFSNVGSFDVPMASHRSEQNESKIRCLNTGASLKDVSFDKSRSAEEKSHESGQMNCTSSGQMNCTSSLNNDASLKNVSFDESRSAEEKSHESGQMNCTSSGQMNCTSIVKKDVIENKDKLLNDPSLDCCEKNVTKPGLGNVDKWSSKKILIDTPELPEEILKEVNDICTSVDEVDSLSTVIPDTFQSKGDGKKSRKQHKPQRVPKVDPNSVLEKPRKINLLRNVVKTLKPEKSRKQDVPKRVVKESDTNGSDLECYFDDENGDSFERIDDEVEDYSTFEQPVNSNQDFSFNERVGESFFEDKDKGRNNDNNNKDSFSKNAFDNNVLGGLNFNTSNSLPLHFQTALLAYNSNKLIQPPLSSDLAVEKLLEHNQEDLTENLEVVKKLREIRYNRYRKISVTEKKEIAEFAKVNGVSTAASHFGVSKSAVSMWTRIDFDDIDDDKESRKKNCMMGNEAFMELLVRVRNEKSNKFKGLSRDDKFEVSRYAKLIGVREMARRLDIALGTVSGWMRQFPYMIKSANQEEEIGQYANEEHETNKEDCTKESQHEDVTTKEISKSGEDENCKNETPNDPGLSTEQYNLSKKIKTEIPDSIEKAKQVQNQYIEKSELKETENTDSKHGIFLEGKKETGNKAKDESKPGPVGNQINSKEDIIKDDIEAKKEPGKNADELDTMIAETYETPDIDQCFDNAKHYLQGTFLENDKFFEILFKRVVECRADKYKALKASEKLEVVRYAKRIGVRRVAKILGLATGTLSGWTTKYQCHLGLTSDGIIDMNSSMSDLDSSLDASQNASNFSRASDSETMNESLNLPSNVSAYISPASSLLDEKAEVTAVKLILKDRFIPLRDKIEIARTIKFRNITREEKIEVVKCTKLAGIRPTARVLNIPIGTLSGWITKYTSNLHPVYQEECDRLGGPSVHRPSQSVNTALAGSQSYVYNIMNSQWPGIHHLSSLYKEPAMELPSELGTQETNLAGLCGKPASDFMLEKVKLGNDMPLQNGNQIEHNMSDKEEHSLTNLKTEPTENSPKEVENSKSDLFSALTESVQGSMLQRRASSNAEGYLAVKTEPVDINSVEIGSKDFSHSQNTPPNVTGVNDNASDGFEEEAKSIAADYLQSVYKKFGLA